MTNKYYWYMLSIMSFSLIFNVIPQKLYIPFILGPLTSHLLGFIMLISFGYSIFIEHRYHNVFYKQKLFLQFSGIYVIISLLSTLHGLYIFPYYDILLNNGIEQIDKLSKFINICSTMGVAVDEKTALVVWYSLRQVKNTILEFFCAFGVSYLVYCWYRNKWEESFKLFCYGTLASFVFIAIYCVIEIWFLSGSTVAKSILITVNPYIHAIKIVKDIWPPLLSWPNQLRAVFAEPSHVGNYIAYALPVLWYFVFKYNDKKYVCIAVLASGYLAFLTFLSKARTATGMYVGLILLVSLMIIILFRNKENLYKLGVLLLVNIFAFGFALSFINQYMTPGKNMLSKKQIIVNNIETNTKNFYNDNLGSLASKTKRSNVPRYAYLKGSFYAGMDHFFLGTGRGLQTMYIIDKMTPQERNHAEIRNWLKYIKTQGLAKNTIDAMNEYVSRFCQTGFLGLLIFLLPFLYVFKQLLLKIRNSREARLEYAFLTLMLFGSMVTAMNGSIFLIYSTWILLGIAYSAVNKDIDL